MRSSFSEELVMVAEPQENKGYVVSKYGSSKNKSAF